MLFLAKIILLNVLFKEQPLLDNGGRTSRIANTIFMEGANFPLGLIANDALLVADE